MDISPMPGMHAPGSPAADSDADMELSSPDPMSSVQSLGFALELPAECIKVMVSDAPSAPSVGIKWLQQPWKGCHMIEHIMGIGGHPVLSCF